MRWLILFLLLFPFNAYAQKTTAQPQDINSITVLAPNSMAVALTELCKIYSLKTTTDVNAVFDSSAETIAAIEDGDPADIVIIPSRKWLAQLDTKGSIDPKTTKVLAKNKLVVAASRFMAVPKSDAKTALNNIYNKTLLLSADENNDSLGEYTSLALVNLGLWEKFSGRSVIAPNSSSVVDLIIKGQSAGIIFATDAKLYSSELNTVALIPNSNTKPIEYLGALVIGEDMAQAKEFLAFLASKEAKTIFIKHGFVVE